MPSEPVGTTCPRRLRAAGVEPVGGLPWPTSSQPQLQEGELTLVRGRWARRIRKDDYFEVLSAEMAKRLVEAGRAVVEGVKLRAV